ncbi:MAG: hypothetical protein U5N86_00065 [Planctomycetota bacterium]|nr:hypothetical protein [Planctomycetota bacterium]
MRVLAALVLAALAMLTMGCTNEAVQAANSYYNIRKAGKVAEDSFSRANAEKIKSNIEKTANKAAADLTRTGDEMTTRVRRLSQMLEKDAKELTKSGRPKIKIDLKQRLKLRANKPR